MSLKKQFLKSKPVCKVTFKAPGDLVGEASEVRLAGDFTEWEKDAKPMRKLKNGDFTLTMDLETGNRYQYRYLVDGERWINDSQPDDFVFNEFANSENSVVSV